MSDPLLNTPRGVYRWREKLGLCPKRRNASSKWPYPRCFRGPRGQVFVFHQSVPAMLAYSPDGLLLARWGNYPDPHGPTLVEEEGEEFFWLTDQDRVVVEKTTTDGKIVAQVTAPAYATNEPYIPTWVAVNETRRGGNGDV